MADTNEIGYEGRALVFAAGLALVAGTYFYTNVSHTLLFWSAFILTRPLGATRGDLLDKPLDHGGSAFGRFYASAILAAFIVAGILEYSSRKRPARVRERVSRTHEFKLLFQGSGLAVVGHGESSR